NRQDGMGYHLYAVTAKHVITDVQKEGCKEIYFRLNFSSKPADFMKSRLSDWVFHPTDPAADVAVLRVSLPDGSDHMNLPVGNFSLHAREDCLSVGDEVFYTGMFSPRLGASKNIPIVRVRNIAALPDEPIDDEAGPMLAYLMEARSLGGMSGSPVFINLGGTR